MLTRLKAGEKTSHQLTRWLHTTRGFNTPKKVKVWRQCVYACFRYSLLPIGFTLQSLKLFDVACFKDLRRICRMPTHLHRNTHQDFLTQNNIPDPLALLQHFCVQAEQRDLQRRTQLADNDILHCLPDIDYGYRCQVLAEALQQFRECSGNFEVPSPDRQFVCKFCQQVFLNLSALRRHQTLEHDIRSGPLRPIHTTDEKTGLPTCQRCGAWFTTWSRFHYHVQFVCPIATQELIDPGEEVEHRLRVQEFLSYASSQHLQALSLRPDLLAYFHTRCSLCQHFCVTTRGLLTHLQSAHNDLFRRHEAHNQHLLSLCDFQSPCVFCGVAYKQYHKCLLLRQLAMLLTRDGVEVPAGVSAESLTCPICRKAYTTKHGLQRHLREYHQATEDCNQMDDTFIDFQCHLYEAVQSNRCADLLQLAEVQSFLATRCILCNRQFSRRQELSRHFKHNHSSEWHECEKRAIELDNQFKPQYGCVCQPQLHSKHICTLYLQFILMRIEHERAHETVPNALPPDMMLGLAEQIEPLLWNGHVKLLYKKRQVRFTLTTCCQLCGLRFGTAAQLTAHLQSQHAERLQETLHLKELLQWTLFMELGCFCNPSGGWGEAHHECVGLSQLAFVIQDFGWQVLVPWTFSSTDLTTVLEPLLPLPVLLRVTMAMMTRNFHRIWDDTDLHAMLRNNCLLCQEEMALERLMPHLVAIHGITDDRLKFLTFQLCSVFANLVTQGGHCEWCGAVLPCRVEGDDLVEYPEEHLVRCPLVIQFSILLMMPVWSKPALIPLTWPTHEAIVATQRQEELKLWQFNAEPSDTFGLSIDLLAQSGLVMLEDPLFADAVNHKCLLCNKMFFSAMRFSEHLHRTHNFMQMLALMCYHRLSLHISMPCRFCGLKNHATPCLSLLNLAIFLTNGYGIRGNRGDRRGQQNMGQSVEQGANANSRDRWHFQWKQQAPQTGDSEKERPQAQGQLQLRFQDPGADGASGQIDQTGHQTRRLHQCDAPRIGVHTTFEPREGECPSSVTPNEPHLAPRQLSSQDAIETSPCPHHDANLGGQDENSHGSCSDGGIVSGLCSVPLSDQQSGQDNAVPALGQSASLSPANGGSGDSHRGDLQEHMQHSEVDGRQQCDTQVSRPEEDTGGGSASTANSLALDFEHAQQSGASAAISRLVASRHLAAHSGEVEATDIGSTAVGGAASEDSLRFGAVRLFLNPSGKACAANSVVACLAWMMLLAGGFVYEKWRCGFELMRNVVHHSLIPLDLMRHDPFAWLLFGEWSIERFLARQQDATEFCDYLLHITQPKFLNCHWDIRPSYVDGLDSVHLAHEKGNQFTPIKLPFIDIQAGSCHLQELVDAWHDNQGLCRAATEVGQIILSIDRHVDFASTKCSQRLDCPRNQILMPYFCNPDGDIAYKTLELCGVIFHLGATPHTGHYRAGLRLHGNWLLYEDGRIPDKVTELPDMVCRNSVLLWFVQLNACNARTLTTAGEAFRTIYTSPNPMQHARW